MSTDRLRSMRYVEWPGGWLVGQMPLLEHLPGIRHGVSTRIGPCGGSLHGGSAEGLANRQSLARAMGVKKVAFVRQVHGDKVARAEDALAGEVEADALMTHEAGVAVLGLSADCPIILAADVSCGAVGMAHASWRGTVQRITIKLIEAMSAAYGCRPERMQAAICPSAGPCCYEVQDDVLAAAREGLGPGADAFFAKRDGRMHLDLWEANSAQLTEAGLNRHNIQEVGVCTICTDRFFSYRRERAAAGRFGGIIARI